VEPFTSNDTYACPDCGSEVKVGARSCPGCGPFRPVEWNDEEENAGRNAEAMVPFHSMTTYTDTREVLEKSRRPAVERLPHEEKRPSFGRVFLVILVTLTVLSAALAALRVFLPQ
jgi:hypothetical protein